MDSSNSIRDVPIRLVLNGNPKNVSTLPLRQDIQLSKKKCYELQNAVSSLVANTLVKASESRRKRIAIPAFCYLLKPPGGNLGIMEKLDQVISFTTHCALQITLQSLKMYVNSNLSSMCKVSLQPFSDCFCSF